MDIRKIFFSLININSNFFGIGYLSKFSEIFVSLTALILCFIPDIQKVAFWLSLSSSAILLFLFKFSDSFRGDNKIVITKVSGMWLAISSFFFQYSILWLIIGFIIYNLFTVLNPFYLKKSNTKNSIILLYDLLNGLLTMIFLHTIYIGYKILPLAIMFFEKN